MKRKNNKTIIISICITISILLVIVIVLNAIINNKKRNEELKEQVNSYTSIEDFKTIEEVSVYLECEYKKQEESKEKDYVTDIYMKLKIMPYTNEKSNEGFYKKLIAYSASVLKYRNFRIIDKDNDITVNVICDSENKKITSYLINGENNYFEKHDSYIEASKIEDTKETKLNIQSNILTKLIENDWKINDSEIGTKESFFNKYDIYFDEGIEVRKVDGNVFNIIFNSKYKEKIANDITTSMTKDEIIKILGEPTFEENRFDFIGYKSENIYLFYNSQKEISIYRVEDDYDSSEFTKIVESYLENKDENELIKNVKEKYTDFDEFESDSQGTILQYALKGIVIRFQKGLSRGIHIYNNYNGSIYNDKNLKQLDNINNLPENVFIKNENLVKKIEIDRIQDRENRIFSYMETRQKKPEISQSNKYCTIKTLMDDGSYQIKFLSMNNNNVNSELKENINYYIWIDDDNFVYSIINKGIYVYNATSRKYGTLITGNNEKFEIKEYKSNLLKYDSKSLTLKLK